MLAQVFEHVQGFIVLAFVVGTVFVVLGIKGAGKWLASLVGLSVVVSLLFGFVQDHPVLFAILTTCGVVGGLAVLVRRMRKGA